MKTAEIKRRWLAFFEERGHTVVPSASVISDDPTLLFNVAGMVQFIPYLTGREPAPYPRATSVQKCVRTQDIEEVGKTTRHGTFFQMNGNFSFGDYFKREAIRYAWQFLTGSQESGGLGFDPERLWATVHHEDEASIDLWLQETSIPRERIQSRGNADNFWHTGQPGPGGYCSEIYFDRGPAYGVEGGPEADEDRYLEIWNLVFMEFALSAVRSKTDFDIAGELPAKNIDTGMGLERVAFLLQGKENMYEIDEVFPVLQAAAELAGKRYGEKEEGDVRLRVVADHVRSALIIIGDGVSPGNEGRGYILRRLLRRAVRSMRLLGVTEPVLPVLLPVSRDAMKASYPELGTDFERISRIAYAEENAFLRTLGAGTNLLSTAVKELAPGQKLGGEVAFELHDTHGFPIDLTLEMAAEHGIEVDEAGFRSLMTEQRDRAKADAKAKKAGGRTDVSAYSRLLEGGTTEFIGYDTLEAGATVRGIVKDGQQAEIATAGDQVSLVLDVTPFYAESGGQKADTGLISGEGFTARVLDVQNPVKGLAAHRVEIVEGELRAGTEALARVDADRRLSAEQAHTATHLVHAALRETLGPGAVQAGSMNQAGYMRFDYSYPDVLSEAARQEIEEIANLAVRKNIEVGTEYLPLDEARKSGAMALFGEKYGSVVRVVDIGGPWSRELCGGTHVRASAEVGPISLLSESSIGSGVRRIEASVGFEAFTSLAKERALMQQLSELLKVPSGDVPDRVAGLMERVRQAEREIAQLRREQALAQAGRLVSKAAQLGGVTLIAEDLGQVSGADDVRAIAQDLRERLAQAGSGAAVVALTGVAKGRPVVVVATSQEAREKGHKAGDLVRLASKELGGGGGGKPDLAQGGGTDPQATGQALAAVRHAIGGS
ncbi:alanine--tRNA ligase [Sediminivirga luteola]|uniref:alanine--tRNA ligase n=1 Tax=Sediminivirga luteola TaxID=1774748 RepID=UPI001F56B1CA|nr:alanine--tRNA ligase [Sediminivirga luteola]MCI2264170.1 alanine--tRNA ligase [Sediminivirga luteola]